MSVIKALVTIVFVSYGVAVAQPLAPEDIDLSAVSEKEVSITDLSDPTIAGKTFVAATVMDASLQKICSAIMNYSEYPQFMPNTVNTKVIQFSEEYTMIEMTLGLPMGKTKKYRLKMESAIQPQSCRLSWKLVPWEELKPSDTIADTTGYWLLTPYSANRNMTLVKYHVYADPGPVPFGLGWIVEMMSKISLPRTLNALRERTALHDDTHSR